MDSDEVWLIAVALLSVALAGASPRACCCEHETPGAANSGPSRRPGMAGGRLRVTSPPLSHRQEEREHGMEVQAIRKADARGAP